jgi:cell wall-associated NlpC family hydrolase
MKVSRVYVYPAAGALISLIATAVMLTAIGAYGQEDPQFPAPDTLQSGDLIWPKKPGALVPYNSQPGEAKNTDAARWEKEKESYLGELRKKAEPTEDEKQRYSALQTMTYDQFVQQYLRGAEPDQPAAFGTGNFSVGHVGIIQIQEGTPTVVEAMIGFGVRRLTYSEWTKQRPGELVWLARLKDVSAEKRAAVAKVAASYIGRPYLFWNFNLTDDTGFYCSKLAWLSVLKGVGFAPDDNDNGHRLLWYSPKQLMRSPRLAFIVNPGNYGTD